MEIASQAEVTTGSLYHHFGSKLGLYRVIREEMETRMTERMEGAVEAIGAPSRRAVQAALIVSFDAAVRFGVTRILSESRSDEGEDRIEGAVSAALPPHGRSAGPILVAAWRGALASVAAGTPRSDARAGLQWVLAGPDVG